MLPATRNGSAPAARPVNRLDSLFDRVFNDDLGVPAPSWGVAAPSWGFGAASLWEDDDHLTVEMELPGVAEQDVDITILKDRLTIRGERKMEEGRRFLYNSRPFGRFERTIVLPEAVDADHAQASYENGVLRITCPKSPEAKPRKIAVTPRSS